MPSFKQYVPTENAAPGEKAAGAVTETSVRNHNIKSVKIDSSTKVESPQVRNLNQRKGINYLKLREEFANRAQRENARFQLNELSRGVMSVEQEENARIETEVQRRTKVLFEALYEKVRKAAYDDGFKTGLADGKTEIQQELAPAVAHLEELVSAFDRICPDMAVASEEVILRIVNQIVKKVLLREVAADGDFVRRTAAQILDRLGTRDNIKIFVAPALIEQSEQLKEGLAKSLGSLRNVTIEPDPSITQGGCRVETEFGDVDATIEAQLKKIDETLKTPES